MSFLDQSKSIVTQNQCDPRLLLTQLKIEGPGALLPYVEVWAVFIFGQICLIFRM